MGTRRNNSATCDVNVSRYFSTAPLSPKFSTSRRPRRRLSVLRAAAHCTTQKAKAKLERKRERASHTQLVVPACPPPFRRLERRPDRARETIFA